MGTPFPTTIYNKFTWQAGCPQGGKPKFPF